MCKIFETFRNIGNYEIGNLTQSAPSCFNGIVSVIKKRITIEDVEEPIEIIQERIQKLWDECTNIHQYEPLKTIGKKYGLNL